jgi:hypothetical protein
MLLCNAPVYPELGSRLALVAEYMTVSLGVRRGKWLAYEAVHREAVMRKGRT